ncbi:hypothetical protein [Phytohabitans aurantiacus]|uniref:Uncharacterized protein n=1 Tax=Phytohabitans aurantiacus TaxID=3016789 RepID=A0ABQ5R0G7_9ACTN|nr:hypothetical protein [Phytohabitans aurantiacus]GLI00302.1 hypothetical protein Pa4123_55780 [Phytohabitans aurantiacus]
MPQFTAGQVLTADALNRAVGLRRVKTADESVGNDTLQNDDHLSIAVAASITYIGEMRLYYNVSAGTAADMKFRLTFPSSDFTWGQLRIPTSVSSGAGTSVDYGGETVAAGTNSATIGVGAGTGVLCAIASFTLFVGGSGGTLQLQWAQNTNTGGVNTVMRKGSSLWIAEV